jgi:hypothetical protein
MLFRREKPSEHAAVLLSRMEGDKLHVYHMDLNSTEIACSNKIICTMEVHTKYVLMKDVTQTLHAEPKKVVYCIPPNKTLLRPHTVFWPLTREVFNCCREVGSVGIPTGLSFLRRRSQTTQSKLFVDGGQTERGFKQSFCLVCLEKSWENKLDENARSAAYLLACFGTFMFFFQWLRRFCFSAVQVSRCKYCCK